MVSKKQIQFYRSLNRKKERYAYKKYWVEGKKIVEEALRDIPERVDKLFSTDEQWGVSGAFEKLTTKQMQQVSRHKTPSGYAAVIDFPEKSALPENGCIFVLDQLQDAGNLGAILRIADWLGIQNIIASENTVDIYNEKVVQASMGSIFRVRINYLDLTEFFRQNWKHDAVGLTLTGTPLKQVEKKENLAIVVGNESNGLNDDVMNTLTQQVCIEGSGNAESLNAAMAAAIAGYQLLTAQCLPGKAKNYR